MSRVKKGQMAPSAAILKAWGWPQHSGRPLGAAGCAGETALCEEGVNVVSTQFAHTGEPLHVAAYAGRLQVVQQLIAAGANIEATDEEDRRPLHIAASRGHADIVEALCAAGASTVAVTEDGTSALQAAQRNGHTHVEAALLSGRM